MSSALVYFSSTDSGISQFGCTVYGGTCFVSSIFPGWIPSDVLWAKKYIQKSCSVFSNNLIHLKPQGKTSLPGDF